MATQTAAVPLNWNPLEERLWTAQTDTFRFQIRRSCLISARTPYSLSAYVHGSPPQVHFRRFKWLTTAQAGAQRFATQHGPRPAHEPNLDDQHFWYLLDAHGCTVFKRYVAYPHAMRDVALYFIVRIFTRRVKIALNPGPQLRLAGGLAAGLA